MKDSPIDRIRKAIAELRSAEHSFVEAERRTTPEGQRIAKEKARGHLLLARDILRPHGALHGQWKSGPVSNQTLHERVEKTRGKPKRCEMCGLADPTKRYEWANLTGKYEDPSDYMRMCVPCHHEYDGICGVRNRKKTHCPQGHEYNLENTIWVKGRRHRICKVCNREKLRKLRHEKPEVTSRYAAEYRARHAEQVKAAKRRAYAAARRARYDEQRDARLSNGDR